MTPRKGTQNGESRFRPLLLLMLIGLIAFIACAAPTCAGETTFAPVLPADIKISADGDVSNFHDLVFDGSRYVSVWTSREPGKIGIQGQFIGTDGVKGTSFLIADNDAATSPKIARAGNGFLVVYYTNNGISGAVVDSGGHVGPIIPICTAENTQSYPEVFAGDSNLLIVWQDARTYGSTEWDVYGRLVSPSGSLIGNDFRIGPSQGTQSFPIGNFNGENYVVIWTQEATVNSAEKDFYGARVSQTGIVLDTNGFGICTASGAQTTLNADCTGGPNGAIALTWTDDRTNPVSLYWTTVSREGGIFDGSPSSSGRLVFHDTFYPPGYPSITYNGREYVIFFGSKSRIIASLVCTDGVVRSPQRVSVIYGANPTRAACAYDGTNYLVSWATFKTGQVFAQMVTDANQVPIAEAGTDGTFEAGRGAGVLDGSLSTDPDGDLPLTYSWTVVSKPANSYPSLKGMNAQQASFTTSVPGQYVYELTVTDAHGAVGLPDRVSFTVTPFTNRPPVLDRIGPSTVTELQQLVIHLSGNDPDGDPIEFGVTTPPTGAVFDKATATFTWTPTATQSRTYYVEFWIRDNTSTYTRETVTIAVLDVNRPPVLAAVGERTVDEGHLLEIILSGTDPDGTVLTYSATDIPAGAALNPATGRFIWTPGYDQAGEYPVTFSVSDGTNSDIESIVIHVIDRDVTPPMITVPATSVPDADGTVVVGVGDAVSATYTINGAPAGLLVPKNGFISIPASAFEATGTYTVTITATDAAGNSATSLPFTVTVDRTPPTISPPAAQVTRAPGGSVTVSVGDAASATYQIGNGDVMRPVIAEHSIGVPAPTAEGTYIVHVTATDAAGNEGRCSFEIVIPHVNRPPVLEAVGDRTVDEGQQLLLPVSGHDPDADNTMTYSASNLPSGAAFDPVTRTFTWTPSFTQAGTYPGVTFEVTDGSLSDLEEIAITVNDVNSAPVFAGIGDRAIAEGQTLEFTISATDAESSTLDYAASNLPSGAHFDPGTRFFTWTPAFTQAGSYANVRFRVTDGDGLSAFEAITIAVTDLNRPPALTPIGPKSVDEGLLLSFTVTGSDPDVDALTFATGDLPAGATFTAATRTFSWTPTYAQAGEYPVTFSVSDGTASDTEKIAIRVVDRDITPPTITVPAAPLPGADGTVAVGVGDAASATYSIDGGPEGSLTPQEGSIRVPVPIAPGAYTVTVRATDAAGNAAISSFSVPVADTASPVIAAPASTNTVPAGGFAVSATDDSGTPTVAYTVSVGGTTVSSGSGPGSVTIPAIAFANTGVYTVTVTATDAARNQAFSTFTVSVDATPPVTDTLAAAPNPAPLGTAITVTACLGDTGAFSSGIASAEVSLDDDPWLPMTAGDAILGRATETVTASLPAFATAGVHSIRIRATDAAGNTAECAEPLLLAVYDPSAGFVTGGGWTGSPAGAYAASPLMTGKATFGFVSKYQKGAKVPTGETEFQFRTADLSFRSGIYEWLVVAGAKAQYKGSGTINGQGAYGFMLTAVDGAVSGGGGADKFRIRIWDRSTGAAVYDNQMDAGDTADPTTVLGGGSIIIHATK